MMTANQVLNKIYKSNSSYDYEMIDELLESYFEEWYESDDVNSLGTFFYACDVARISRTTASKIAEAGFRLRRKIPTYTGFINSCVYQFDKSFNIFLKDPSIKAPVGMW